jgi:hypothetical protein
MSASEQIAQMRSSLTQTLLRKSQLTRELKTCDEQADALTNFLAGAEVGALEVAEKVAAKVAAEKAVGE